MQREQGVRDWDWDEDDEPPPRRGLGGRIVSLLKLALLVVPLALFLAGDLVADCGAPGGEAGLARYLKAGACARTTILGNALSLPDNLGALRRAFD